MRLEEALIRTGSVSPEDIAEAKARAGPDASDRAVAELLVREGKLSEQTFLATLAAAHGCDVVTEVPDAWLDPALVTNLPVEWARARVVLPVRRNGRLTVLMTDPSDLATLEDIALVLGAEPEPVLASAKTILSAIERCYMRGSGTPRDVLRSLSVRAEPAEQPLAEDLLRSTGEASVTQFINAMLLEALKARASDIHIEPFAESVRIRYRIDGLLYEQAAPPKALEAALVSRLKVMARLDIAEKRLPQDGTARVRVGDQEVDIRVSTVPVAEGERVVLRLLHRESALLALAELGMSDRVLSEFRRLIGQTSGIILVTGPTGSGKTTTLYAALQELDHTHTNILTIEDPIEYKLPNIGQMQVKPKIGLTFATGLRHILRQDPDVILVGEIRDLETAEIAIRAALTGHLVFSTLHTNDAPSAVLRLMDMGVEPYLLAACLRGVMAQRLVRCLCRQCRRPATPDAASAEALGVSVEDIVTSWEAVGCPQCREGYRGRTGLFELLSISEEAQEAIRGRQPLRDLRDLMRRHRMPTLRDDVLEKIRAGTTSLAEAIRVLGRSASADVSS